MPTLWRSLHLSAALFSVSDELMPQKQPLYYICLRRQSGNSFTKPHGCSLRRQQIPLLNNTSNKSVLRWGARDATKTSTSKPRWFPSQHWDFQSKSQWTGNYFVLDLGDSAQRQSWKAGEVSHGSEGWDHRQHTFLLGYHQYQSPLLLLCWFWKEGRCCCCLVSLPSIIK